MKKLLLLPLLLVTCFCLAQDAKEIIGKPIKIGNLHIAQHDFPILMKWDDAKKACTTLGKGWRLPTSDEWDILIKNKDQIPFLTGMYYWSSTEVGYEVLGQYNLLVGVQYKFDTIRFSMWVRAVRSL
jgi:hypothetical protein